MLILLLLFTSVFPAYERVSFIWRAISALEHSKAEVQALLQRRLFCMTFRGIGQFNHKVIYVKMSADEQHTLSKIAG